MAHPPALPIFGWLTTSGGSREAAVNGSVTAVEFEYSPPEEEATITHLHFVLLDTGSIDATKYGNMAAALTNGILIEVIYADGSSLDLTGGFPIKTTGEWLALCDEVEHHIHGQGPEAYVGSQSYNGGIHLSPGDVFRVTVQDNLTTLDSHLFRVDGTLT